MYTITDAVNALQRSGVTLDIGDRSIHIKDCSAFVGELLGSLDHESLYRVSSAVSSKSLIYLISDWLQCKFLPTGIMRLEPYVRYYKGDYEGALTVWFNNSRIYTKSPIIGRVELCRESVDIVGIFKYLPKETFQLLVEHLLFYTNDFASYAKFGCDIELGTWLELLARMGYLRFDPYIAECPDGFNRLVVKYNKVLEFRDCRFWLMCGESVYAYSGTLPGWDFLNGRGEELAAFVYFIAANSVLLSCSDFATQQNHLLLAEYIRREFKSTVGATRLLDKAITKVDRDPLRSGVRIAHNGAWDYARWRMGDTLEIELPGVMCTNKLNVDLGSLQKKTHYALTCDASLWNNLSKDDFQLITGVLALFGIMYTDKCCRVVKDATMPALFPHKFETIEV